MDFTFLGKVLTQEQAAHLRHKLLERLATHLYSDREECIPISCQIKPMQQGHQLDVTWFSGSGELVVFMENYDTMVLSTSGPVLKFLNNREPWQDFDVCIFDQEVTWCVALTHNDEAKFVRLTTDEQLK